MWWPERRCEGERAASGRKIVAVRVRQVCAWQEKRQVRGVQVEVCNAAAKEVLHRQQQGAMPCRYKRQRDGADQREAGNAWR